MGEHHTRQCLDLDIAQRGALDLGEMADLSLGEFDVLDGLRRDLGDEIADRGIAEAEARRRPFVETLRQFAYRPIAALGDIGDDRLDRGADLGVGFFLLAGQRRPLDVSGHDSPLARGVGIGVRKCDGATYMRHGGRLRGRLKEAPA